MDVHAEPPEELELPSVPASVARVRRYAADACAARGFDGDYDTLALLVSEIATNALVHGSGRVRVRVLGSGGRVRIEITDGSTAAPRPQRAGTDAEGGRGLALVDALSAAWGTRPLPDGKTVWFELAA